MIGGELPGADEKGEQWPQALPPGGERVGADGGDDTRMAGHGGGEPLLDDLQVVVEAGRAPDELERRHLADPV